jgi:hypothetical protein
MPAAAAAVDTHQRCNFFDSELADRYAHNLPNSLSLVALKHSSKAKSFFVLHLFYHLKLFASGLAQLLFSDFRRSQTSTLPVSEYIARTQLLLAGTRERAWHNLIAPRIRCGDNSANMRRIHEIWIVQLTLCFKRLTRLLELQQAMVAPCCHAALA